MLYMKVQLDRKIWLRARRCCEGSVIYLSCEAGWSQIVFLLACFKNPIWGTHAQLKYKA